MEKVSTKHFSNIDLTNLEEWYGSKIVINGHTIDISISVSKKYKIDPKNILEVDQYVENLKINEENIRRIIQQDFKEQGETNSYLDTQIEEQEIEDILTLIEKIDNELSVKEKLLSILSLLRIVFYPEREDKMFAVFDYTIDSNLTDDLLAVKLYKDKNVSIDIES